MTDAIYIITGDPESLDLQRLVAMIKYSDIDRKKIRYFPSLRTNPNEFSGEPLLRDFENKVEFYDGRSAIRYLTYARNESYIPYWKLRDESSYAKATAPYENFYGSESHRFDPLATESLQQARAKAENSGHDAKRYADSQAQSKVLLKYYDKELAKHKFLYNDEMSAVDLFHVPVIHASKEYPDAVPGLKELPNAARWWGMLSKMFYDSDPNFL